MTTLDLTPLYRSVIGADRVAKMLKNVQFTGDEINGWIVEMFENKRDPQDVAEEWIEDNQEIVNGWING